MDKPTLGRIVIYTTPEQERIEPRDIPAIVNAVLEDGPEEIGLFVLDPIGGPHQASAVAGADPGTWHWPERV